MSEFKSYRNLLVEQLQEIEKLLINLLDISVIVNDQNDGTLQRIISWHWGKSNNEQIRLQSMLKDKYSAWFEHFQLLFHNAPSDLESEIKESNLYIMDLINRTGIAPTTIENGKSELKDKIKKFYGLLSLYNTDKSELIVVPDTSGMLTELDPVKYSEVLNNTTYTVAYTPTVIQELDKLKTDHTNNNVREKAKKAIRRLKGWRKQKGDIVKEGVILNKTVTVKFIASEPDISKLLAWLEPNNNDDRIIASALEIQIRNPSTIVVLMTNDLNQQTKATFAGLPFVEPPGAD